jgi:serine/threonine protein kinase
MVRFYGAMFRESNVWICMEVMDVSLDKFYKMCVKTGTPIPEPFIAKVALALVEGLGFMKTGMNLIHR